MIGAKSTWRRGPGAQVERGAEATRVAPSSTSPSQVAAQPASAPLPRANRVPELPPVETAHGLAARAMAFLHRHHRAAAGAMLGASVLPGLSGTALAAPASVTMDTGAIPAHQDAPSAANVDLARAMLFDAPPTGGVVTAEPDARERVYQADAIQHAPARLDPASAALLGMRDALMRRLLERASLDRPDVPQPPVSATERSLYGTTIATIDAALASKSKIPPGLLSDLDRATQALAGASTGNAADRLASAFRTAPRLDRSSDALFRVLSGAEGAPDPAAAIARYAKATAGIEKRLPFIPGFRYSVPVPLDLAGPGYRIAVPAGAVLDGRGGAYQLQAPGLLLQQGGTTLQAGSSTIKLSGDLATLDLANAKTTTPGATIAATGAHLAVDRRTGASRIEAASATLDLASGHVDLTNARLVTDPSGAAALDAGRADWSHGTDAASFNALHVTRDGSAIAGGAAASSVTTGGLTATADRLGFSIKSDTGGVGTGHFDAQGLTLRGADGLVLTAPAATLDLTTRADGSSSTLLSTRDASLVLAGGRSLSTTGAATIDLEHGPGGALQSVSAKAAALRWRDPQGNLQVTGGQLDLAVGAGGQVTSAKASAGQASWTGAIGTLTAAKGGTLNLAYGADGKLSSLDGAVSSLVLDNKGGVLSLGGATAKGTFGPDGALQSLTIHSDQVGFAGPASNGHLAGVTLSGADLVVKPLSGGGQDLRLSGNGASLQLDGNSVAIDSVRSIQIKTDTKGTITAIDADFPGAIRFDQKGGDLGVVLTGTTAHYSKDGAKLSAAFDDATVRLVSKDLTAEIHGGSASLTPQEARLHIDSASVLEKLGEPLSAKVESLDVVVARGADGAPRSLDSAVAGLEGHVKGIDAMVRTTGGDRVRLHLEADADGKLVRQAWLQIPTGGEIEIAEGDTSVKLGPQTITLERVAGGAYRLSDDHLDVSARFKDTQVRVTGGSASVKLDPASGGVIIEQIHGTKIDVATGSGLTASIDIKQLDGFLVKATGISGLTKGAEIHLVPTGDGSTMTLSVHATYKGLPLSVELKNVHAFDAIATVGPGGAHVLIQDPSRRGNIKISAGPLAFQGSAIEIFAKYQAYDPARMLSLVGRYLSTDGIQLVRGVTIEPDGVVRLGTPNQTGVKASLAVLLPRGTGSTPMYLWDPGDGAKDGAPGAIANLGVAGRSGSGTIHSGSIFFGLVPGSYVDWKQTQGTASLAGVPLPRDMKIPSTAVAGLSYGRTDAHSTFAATAGAYVNPGNFVSPADEKARLGLFGGVHYQNGNLSAGVDALVDLGAGGAPKSVGAAATLGFTF